MVFLNRLEEKSGGPPTGATENPGTIQDEEYLTETEIETITDTDTER